MNPGGTLSCAAGLLGKHTPGNASGNAWHATFSQLGSWLRVLLVVVARHHLLELGCQGREPLKHP